MAAESGKIGRVLKRKEPKRSNMVFSPRSDLIACQIGKKDDVQIWDVNTGKVIQMLQGPGYDWATVAFSYDSKYLVVGYKRHVRIWCVESGENLYKFDYESNRLGSGAVAISLDSKFVALGDCDGVQIWEPRTGHCVHRFGELAVRELTFSSDSTFLAIIGGLNNMQIWEAATGACLFSAEAKNLLDGVSFDPVKGDILTHDLIFKNSAWEHWDMLPRRGYTLSDVHWIYLDGTRTLRIPVEFRGIPGSCPISSNTLLAYTSFKSQVIIMKLPSYHGLKGQETKILEYYSANHPDRDSNIASNADTGYLVDKEFGPSTSKKRRLE